MMQKLVDKSKQTINNKRRIESITTLEIHTQHEKENYLIWMLLIKQLIRKTPAASPKKKLHYSVFNDNSLLHMVLLLTRFLFPPLRRTNGFFCIKFFILFESFCFFNFILFFCLLESYLFELYFVLKSKTVN